MAAGGAELPGWLGLEVFCDAIPGGVLAIGPDLRVSYATERAAKHWALAPDELIGVEIDALCEPGCAAGIRRVVDLGDRQGQPFCFCIVGPSGNRCVDAMLKVSEGNGALLLLLQQQGHGRHLSAVESQSSVGGDLALEAVFDSLPFECWTTDTDGRFVLQNPRSLRRWGSLQQRLIIEAGLDAELANRWQEDTLVALAGEVVRRDLAIEREDGNTEHFDRLIVPIVRGSEILGALGVSVPATEQKQLEQQLMQTQKLDAIGRLAGGIAHDFNNVLTAIMTCVRLLEKRLEGPPRKELQIIRDGTQRASELTRQLLAFAKQEMVEPCLTVIDELLLRSDRLLRRVIGEDVELVTIANAHKWKTFIDPIRLEQAIMNLVVNARDALPDGGKITLQCEAVHLREPRPSVEKPIPPGDYVVLSVSDTGEGMSEATRERAFEPFFTTRQESGGTGLGLSTVYGSVRQAKGYLTLESEYGVGTTFCLYFPRAKSEASDEVLEPDESLATQGGNETILVVEDEPLVRAVTCQSLEMLGYRVLKAASLQEALSVSRDYADEIDLLLTDVVMPLGSGPELAATLQEERPGLGVVLMSGYTTDRVSIELSGVTFLPKPFTPDILAAKLRKALAERRAEG